MNFDLAVDYVLANECHGDETNIDAGGLTKFGISLRFLRTIPIDRLKTYGIFIADSVTEDDIKCLDIEQAKAIYRGEFWNNAPFDKINDAKNRNFIFDMGVNMGISPAIKCAQRACWAVMKKRQIILDDGIMGDETIHLINQCGFYLLAPMRSERASYYRLIVANNPSQQHELSGWLNRAYGG